MSAFSADLRTAMTHRGMTVERLATTTKLNRATISKLRRGVHSPTMDTASRLADALDWDSLSRLAAEARRATCYVCGTAFLSADSRRRFCSQKCITVNWARKAQAYRVRRRARYEKRTSIVLREHQQAVEAFCRSCEPVDFICRDDGCALRGVSPLPCLIQVTRRRVA